MADLYLPAPTVPPDREFRETVAGGHALVLEHTAGHALVIQYGDAEFWLTCQCGADFVPGALRPDKPWLPVVAQWLAHCPPTLPPEIRPHCQCGGALLSPMSGTTTEAVLDAACQAWEQHCLAEVNP